MYSVEAAPVCRETQSQGWYSDAEEAPQVPPAWALVPASATDCPHFANPGATWVAPGGYPADPGTVRSNWEPAQSPMTRSSGPETGMFTDHGLPGWIPAQRIPYTSWDTGHGWWKTTPARYRSPDCPAAYGCTNAAQPDKQWDLLRSPKAPGLNMVPPPPPPGAPKGNRIPPPPPKSKPSCSEVELRPKTHGVHKCKPHLTTSIAEPLEGGMLEKTHPVGKPRSMLALTNGITIKPPPPKKCHLPIKAPPLEKRRAHGGDGMEPGPEVQLSKTRCCSGPESIEILAQQTSPKRGREGFLIPTSLPEMGVMTNFKAPPPEWPEELEPFRKWILGSVGRHDTALPNADDPFRKMSRAERLVAEHGDEYRLIQMRDETSMVNRNHELLVRDRQGRVGRVEECYDSNGNRQMKVSMSCEWMVMDIHSSTCKVRSVQFQYFWNIYTCKAQLQAPESLTEVWTTSSPMEMASSPVEDEWCHFKGFPA